MAGGGSHGGGGGGGGGGGALNDIVVGLFQVFLVIGICVACFRQCWVAVGGDPKTVGAYQADYPERRARMQAERERRAAGGRQAVAASVARPATHRLNAVDAGKAKELGISLTLYGMILRSSVKYQQPAGAIYGFKVVESGKREGSTGGNCLAYEQYEIRDRWLGKNPDYHRTYRGKRYPNGTANALALQEIAKRYGIDWKTIRGSCGKSTMTSRENSFGGCLWDGQITPVEWLNNPEFRERDPRDTQAALDWISYRMQKRYREAIAKGDGHAEARSKSIRQYPGNAEGWGSWKYYVKKLMPKWQKWNDVHGVGRQNSLYASN